VTRIVLEGGGGRIPETLTAHLTVVLPAPPVALVALALIVAAGLAGAVWGGLVATNGPEPAHPSCWAAWSWA